MVTEYQFDVVVIGAGVVGLSVAASAAQKGLDVIVLEKEATIGSITSSRNSEVIHAGIYYPLGSAKALHCVKGRKLLYNYLEERKINFAKVGKYIVASNKEEEGLLATIYRRAMANQAGKIEFVSSKKLAAVEPEVLAVAALFSPETGILDSHGMMLALQGDIEASGGVIALGQKVISVMRKSSAFDVYTEAACGEKMTLQTSRVVNAAGHGALPLSKGIEGLDTSKLPKRRFAKGTYMKLEGKQPFRHLIYPIPVPGALGIHATLDLNGRTRFGPNIEWIDHYDVDPTDCDVDSFYAAIRRYWPNLRDCTLTPDYSGVRPKLERSGQVLDDFLIETSDQHGIEGLVSLYGIESPGLTAALSLGAEITERLQ